jgi:hypothetical protein
MGRIVIDWDKKNQDILDREKKLNGGFEKDTRFWSPPKDKAGNYNSASVIRFIPDSNFEVWAKVYFHSFKYEDAKKEKRQYFKNCITTFGWEPKCLICDKNGPYFKSNYDKDKKIAAARGRKFTYISNILVINNPENPEDNGKIFLFKYGKQIFSKIEYKQFPKEENIKKAEALGEKYIKFPPFDFYDGANFKLVVKPQGKPNSEEIYPNYEDSTFYPASELFDGDEDKIKELLNKTVDLSEFYKPELFPTNEEVQKIVGHLWRDDSNGNIGNVDNIGGTDDANDDIPFFGNTAPKDTPVVDNLNWEPTPISDTTIKPFTGSPDDDDDAFFDTLPTK